MVQLYLVHYPFKHFALSHRFITDKLSSATENDLTHPQGALAKLLHLGAPFGKRRPGGRVRPGRLGQGALALGGGFDQGALLKAPSGRPGRGALAEPTPRRLRPKPRQGALGLGNLMNLINNTGV